MSNNFTLFTLCIYFYYSFCFPLNIFIFWSGFPRYYLKETWTCGNVPSFTISSHLSALASWYGHALFVLLNVVAWETAMNPVWWMVVLSCSCILQHECCTFFSSMSCEAVLRLKSTSLRTVLTSLLNIYIQRNRRICPVIAPGMWSRFCTLQSGTSLSNTVDVSTQVTEFFCQFSRSVSLMQQKSTLKFMVFSL